MRENPGGRLPTHVSMRQEGAQNSQNLFFNMEIQDIYIMFFSAKELGQLAFFASCRGKFP